MKKKKTLWFRAKNYGWGWYPATWQGWLVLTLYLLFIIYRGVESKKLFDTVTSYVFRFSWEFAISTSILIAVCYLTGEKPEWRWGKKK